MVTSVIGRSSSRIAFNSPIRAIEFSGLPKIILNAKSTNALIPSGKHLCTSKVAKQIVAVGRKPSGFAGPDGSRRSAIMFDYLCIGAYAFRMMGLFQQSGLNFISLPTENAYLQGRQDSYPKRRGLTRVKELWESGINVCFGQDSINDPWYPVGNGNLMNILDNGIHLAQTMSFDELDRCLDLITYNGAKTLNVEGQYGIEEGKPANFLVLDADTPFEAVRQRADVLASIRNGEYLFKRPEPGYEIELDVFRKTT